MTAKLQDVAKLAGVSVTTASRVINRKGYLSQKTIDKVEAAMQQLHYTPNAAARSLQGKSLSLIGLIFPNVSNIFYAELIQQIEQSLYRRGYKAMLATTEHDEQKERDYLAMLLANQVDGLIYGSHNLTFYDYQAINAPIVAFDRYLTDDIPIVGSDNFQGGKLATEALIGAGAREILLITGADNTNSPTKLRREGYQEVVSSHSLTKHVLKLSSDLTLLRREMEISKALSDGHFDAVFATDDLTALIVKRIAAELGLTKLAIIGFDGTDFIRSYQPDLATIQQPIPEIAELLVETLLRKIAGGKIENSYELPVQVHFGDLH